MKEPEFKLLEEVELPADQEWICRVCYRQIQAGALHKEARFHTVEGVHSIRICRSCIESQDQYRFRS